MELTTYRDIWREDDPHANFKAEVAAFSVADPLPTLENLSQATGIPVPTLVRYILVKYVASGADAMLTMTPLVIRQMEEHIAKAEAVNTAAARLRAYEALRQMIAWLSLGAESPTA
ncbi:MAG: hypothetical protein KJZ93_13965 [Caldilineaceae bacterium]|nr:hypothetical protein [Caldilineaceae bacterium]